MLPSRKRKFVDEGRVSNTTWTAHDDAVKVSYIIAQKIAAASRPYSDGEFVKECMLAAADLLAPEKRQAFANVSLSRNTIAERIRDIAGDLNRQLKDKVKSFIAFSLAIDESTDVTDVAQLAIFIRGVDASVTVTEEFVELVPMTDTTTANDVFNSLVAALDRLEVDWSRTVSIATGGTSSMMAGVAVKLREKVKAQNPDQQFWNFPYIIHQDALCIKSLKMDNVMEVVIETVHFIRSSGLNQQFDNILSDKNIGHGLPYHTEVQWLSRGAVLKRFFQLRAKIGLFMKDNRKPLVQLDDPDWVHDLAFLVDITDHLNVLNVTMQGRKKLVTEYERSIAAFQMKLRVWQEKLSKNILHNFPTLLSVNAPKKGENVANENNGNMHRYMDKLSHLEGHLASEFQNSFHIFAQLKTEFSVFRYPFETDAESDTVQDLGCKLQMELIDIQHDDQALKEFKNGTVEEFYQNLGLQYPAFKMFASKILSMFGTTYLCEQAFSVMNINKSKLRPQLTHRHLNDIMKVSTTQKLVPDVDKLVKAKRCQVSNSMK